ncbi:MAG TPA: glycosyltransferase family 1 protein [Acidimicrobiales bacterium]|nr:glycosyltransferase family 1 protein [Acidimicrobiales bacterium]
MEVTLVVEQLRRAVAGEVSGIGTYTLGLLQGLAAMGHEAPAITLHASRATTSPDPLAVHGHPVAASRLPGRLLTRAWDRSALRAPAGPGAAVHSTSLAFPPGTTSVMVHDLAWRDVPDAYPPRGRRWHEAALARAIHDDPQRLLLAPARVTADALVAAGAGHHRIEVVAEGADHLPPADLEGAQRILDGLGVREGFLLTVGTLQPRKNLRRLLDAYALARPELPEPWPLVVVGPRGWGEQIPTAEVPHGVLLAGEVRGAELAGLYRRARCLAFVPLAEGFGLPPVEAMRECTPVVATPGVPAVAGTGAVIEVDALDVRAIATGLVRASSDDRIRSELVTAGLELTEGLTWEAAARRHVELWADRRR